MNIAFGTVLIFLIIIPGIIYRKLYFHGIFSKKYAKTNPFDDFAWAIIPGFLFQTCGVIFLKLCFPYEYHVNFKIIGTLLVGVDDVDVLLNAFDAVEQSIVKILTYNITIWGIAGATGYFLRKFVRWCELDLKTMHVRFSNEWYYIITGEILKFAENTFQPKLKIDLAFVDVLVKIDDESIIYTGIAKAYFLGNDGGLASILLAGTKRRALSDDPETQTPTTGEDSRYYNIPGEFMLIPNSSIININFRYIDLDEERPISQV